MAVNRSSGSEMPSRCRGLSSGSSSHTQPTMVPRFSFSSAPPIPKPPNPRSPRASASSDRRTKSRAALRRKSSYCAPCTTPHSDCSGLPARSWESRWCSVRQRSAQRVVRASDSSWYSRVSMSVVSSSNANMMSAPKPCWICMETSGVKRCLEPSMTERKSTPSLSTCARRSFFAARMSFSVRSAMSMASTLRKPTPSDMTWKPPESV